MNLGLSWHPFSKKVMNMCLPRRSGWALREIEERIPQGASCPLCGRWQVTEHVPGSCDLFQCNQITLLKDGTFVLPTFDLGNNLAGRPAISREGRGSERLWKPSIYGLGSSDWWRRAQCPSHSCSLVSGRLSSFFAIGMLFPFLRLIFLYSSSVPFSLFFSGTVIMC